MADSFQQRISLEGAEDIIKNLQQIGAEATKAIGQLKTAVTSANPALAALSTTSLAAQNALKGFGAAISQATTLITPFSASLGGLLSTFGAFAGPAGILAAAGGLGLFIKNAADAAIAVDRQSRALGLTIDQFKALRRVVGEAGLSSEELVTGVTRISGQVAAEAQAQFKGLIDVAKQVREQFAGSSIRIVTLDDINKLKTAIAQLGPQLQAQFAAAGDPFAKLLPPAAFIARIQQIAQRTDEAGAAMRKLIETATGLSTAITPFEKLDDLVTKNEAGIKSLRISFLDSKGATLDTFEAILRLADELNKLPEGAQKTATALKLAGRGIGPELFQALSGGRANIEGIVKELEKVGIDPKSIQSARDLRKALLDLEQGAKSVQNSFLTTFGPGLAAGLRSTATDFDNLKKLFSGTFEFKFSNPFAAGPGSIFGGIGDAVGKIVAMVKADFADLGVAIKESFGAPFNSLVELVRPALSDLIAAIRDEFSGINVSAILDGIVQAFTALPGRIAAALGGLPEILAAPFRAAVDLITGLWDRVINKIREVLGLSQQGQSAAEGVDAGGGGGGGSGFAGGGFIRGAGTGTSDSILARLSRGEFVIRAAAVSHYGPQLLHALNAMRLPRLPGFSLGGLADGLGRTLRANLAIPGMAAGGPIPAPAKAATVPITLDLRTDRGRFRGSAMADREVAEALSRFAVIDQITSMGKKSGAY